MGPGERVTFQTGNVGGVWFAMMMVLQLGIPRIFLTRETPDCILDVETLSARNTRLR